MYNPRDFPIFLDVHFLNTFDRNGISAPLGRLGGRTILILPVDFGDDGLLLYKMLPCCAGGSGSGLLNFEEPGFMMIADSDMLEIWTYRGISTGGSEWR